MRPDLDRVVVGQQRIVGRVDDGPSDPRTHAHDDQEPPDRRQAGQEREDRQHRRPTGGHPNAGETIGGVRDRHLQRQRPERDQRDQGQDAGVGEAVRVADLGHEDGEGRPIQLVHRIESEQHQQRIDRTVTREVGEPSVRMPGRGSEPRPPGPEFAGARRTRATTRSAAPVTLRPPRARAVATRGREWAGVPRCRRRPPGWARRSGGPRPPTATTRHGLGTADRRVRRD